MQARRDPSQELLQLADLQAGALTVEQIEAYGLGRSSVRRLVDQGRWQRLSRGVYFVGRTEPPWLGWAWAGVLLGGERARLGGPAAGFLHGLVPAAPEQIEVFVPVPQRPESRGRLRFHGEWTGIRGASVGSPARTSVPDTVLDLCEKASEGQVVELVLQAVQERRTTVSRMTGAMERRGRVRDRSLLTDLLADAAEGAESPLELRYLRDVERAHGLPTGSRQQQWRHRLGRDVRDVRYDQFATVVELDGRRGHDGMGRFRDMRRDNRAVADGEAVLRYGWWDVVERTCAAAWQVGEVLASRGWPGPPRRCVRCRRVPIGRGEVV